MAHFLTHLSLLLRYLHWPSSWAQQILKKEGKPSDKVNQYSRSVTPSLTSVLLATVKQAVWHQICEEHLHIMDKHSKPHFSGTWVSNMDTWRTVTEEVKVYVFFKQNDSFWFYFSLSPFWDNHSWKVWTEMITIKMNKCEKCVKIECLKASFTYKCWVRGVRDEVWMMGVWEPRALGLADEASCRYYNPSLH